jgi:hypothetical protein
MISHFQEINFNNSFNIFGSSFFSFNSYYFNVFSMTRRKAFKGGANMKSMLIIGGDRLGSIIKNLEGEGFNEVIHLSGRKKQFVRKDIPRKVDLILVLTDFINHNLSAVIKRKAQELGIPICFSKRSWCFIHEEIQKFNKSILIN